MKSVSLFCLRSPKVACLPLLVGLFIGIDLIFSGVSWIMLAIGIHTAFSSKT